MGLEFLNPWLLLGALAAAIPPLLHLLSNVRAPQAPFPTLRFLRLSMDRTARRRKVKHWLLMVLRSAMLALLAMAVAQPLTRSRGSWLGKGNSAAVIVIDNSLSMNARGGEGTPLAAAKAQASALLGGDDRPAIAALLTTNGSEIAEGMTADLALLRRRLSQVAPTHAQAPLARRVAQALEMLAKAPAARKALYLLTDMQAAGLAELAELEAAAAGGDVRLMVIDTGSAVDNVGVAAVDVQGRLVVHQQIVLRATLVNSSASARTVEVAARVAGRNLPAVSLSLAPVGSQGSRAMASFVCTPGTPGEIEAEVFLTAQDDQPADNSRRLVLRVAPAIRALIVRGEPPAPPAVDCGTLMELALSGQTYAPAPWSIDARVIDLDDLSAGQLDEADVVILCEPPAFTEAQAQAIEAFVRRGGSAALFMGPGAQLDNYAATVAGARPGALVPVEIDPAAGQVGTAAAALASEWADIEHPLLAGLYDGMGSYLSPLVQRHFPVRPLGRSWRTLVRLAGGDPLMLVRDHGRGRLLLCTTPASARWSNLAGSGAALLLPTMLNLCLDSRPDAPLPAEALCGMPVRLALPAAPGDAGALTSVTVTGPDGLGVQGAGLDADAQALVIEPLDRPGFYRWQVSADGLAHSQGALALNVPPAEVDLARTDRDAFASAMPNRPFAKVYVADSLAAAAALAAADDQGTEWWDLLLVVVVLALITESVIANRHRKQVGAPRVEGQLAAEQARR